MKFLYKNILTEKEFMAAATDKTDGGGLHFEKMAVRMKAQIWK